MTTPRWSASTVASLTSGSDPRLQALQRKAEWARGERIKRNVERQSRG